MTEHQTRHKTVTIWMLLNLRKAEIRRLAGPGSRKANLQHAVETMRQAELRDQGHSPKQGVPLEHTWLTIACNHRSGLVNMALAENRDKNWYAGLLHQEKYRVLTKLRVTMIAYEQVLRGTTHAS